MKNSTIHEGLEKKEVRDYLARALAQVTANVAKKQEYPYDRFNAIEWAIKDTENEIKFQNHKLVNLKEKAAILTIIKMNGWEEWDVSDETEKDIPDLHYSMPFIGTATEYNNLLLTVSK